MSTIGTNLAIEAAVRLGTLIDTHARDVGRQLGDRLRPFLYDGESLPDFTLVLVLPARMLRQAGQRLRARQNDFDEARSHEGEALFQRDQTASALRRNLVAFRRILTSLFGSRRTATLLGVGGKTAQTSQSALLLSQADAFLSALRDAKRLPIPDTAYFEFDPAPAADALEPLIAACREAHGRLDEMRQARAARREAKYGAETELWHGVRYVVFILGGWLALIRRKNLIEKLHLIHRPSRSRKEVPM